MMEQEEIDFLFKKLKNVNRYPQSPHAQDRKSQKRISEHNINKVFENFEIIEYHTEKDEPRVLIRCISDIIPNVCMVVAPLRKIIITVYVNSPTDFHDTIRMDAYNEHIDVIKSYKKYKLPETNKNGIRVL
jgi:hypothetical protein